MYARNMMMTRVAHSFQEWTQPSRGKSGNHYKDPKDVYEKLRKKQLDRFRNKRAYVYYVEFSHKKTGYTFTKVGITSQTLNERFQRDVENFDIKLIDISKNMRFTTALKYEKAIHNLMILQKERPEIALSSGGNTECYNSAMVIRDQIKKLFDPVRYGVDTVKDIG